MTGIERLHEVVRELGRFSFCYDLYETLGNIADQIERERECDADTIENLRLELGEARDDAAWVREHGVRCRDCKHAITSYRDGLPRCAGPLVMEATLVSPDGFCAWGERKGE